MLEACFVAACVWLGLRTSQRARAEVREAARLATKAATGFGAMADCIEQVLAKLADVQAGLSGIRALLRDIDRDDGEPPIPSDPLADFLARRELPRL